MKYELKQSIYNTPRICCGWLGTRDITLLPATLTVCYTVYLAKYSTKFRTVRWWEKHDTLRDLQYKRDVTLHKLISWLLFTGSYLSLASHLQSNMIISLSAVQQSLKSSSEWQKNIVPTAIRSTTEFFWSLSRKLLMFSAFYGNPTDVQFQWNRPKWPFPTTHQKPCLALSGFWHILAVTAECCPAPPTSLPTVFPRLIWKATSPPIAFHFFSP